MKSPIKYSKWPIILCFLVSLFIIGITLNTVYLSGEVITLGRIICSAVGVLVYTLVGWWIAVRFTGTLFYRQVDQSHRIEPRKLIQGTTYWLNGKTPAIFIGMLEHSGTYLFHIQGFNKKDVPYDAKALFPDQVRKFISTQQEVF